jgi:hypothetical protein
VNLNLGTRAVAIHQALFRLIGRGGHPPNAKKLDVMVNSSFLPLDLLSHSTPNQTRLCAKSSLSQHRRRRGGEGGGADKNGTIKLACPVAFPGSSPEEERQFQKKSRRRSVPENCGFSSHYPRLLPQLVL